jgi:hypothetical protein
LAQHFRALGEGVSFRGYESFDHGWGRLFGDAVGARDFTAGTFDR